MNKLSETAESRSRRSYRSKPLAWLAGASLVLGGSAAVAPTQTHAKESSKTKELNEQTHRVASHIAARILKLDNRTVKKEFANLKLVEGSIDTGSSLVPGHNGKYWFDAFIRVGPSGIPQPRYVQRLYVSEGEGHTFNNNLANMYLEDDVQSWYFNGNFQNKGNGVEIKGATDSSRYHNVHIPSLTSDKITKIGATMDGVLDMALAGQPTGYLQPPFKK